MGSAEVGGGTRGVLGAGGASGPRPPARDAEVAVRRGVPAAGAGWGAPGSGGSGRGDSVGALRWEVALSFSPISFRVWF